MKNINLTFGSLNELLNKMGGLIPELLKSKLHKTFNDRFHKFKADQPSKWSDEIKDNEMEIINYLLLKVSWDPEVRTQCPYTFHDQFFVTFSQNDINEKKYRKLKHLKDFDNFLIN